MFESSEIMNPKIKVLFLLELLIILHIEVEIRLFNPNQIVLKFE
jgi:hypothetical protein